MKQESNNTDNGNSSPYATTTTLGSTKFKIAFVLALCIGGLAMLILLMFNSTAVELKTVTAIAASPPSDSGVQIGMKGKLLPDSFVREPNGITANFYMIDEDGDVAIPVKYSGELPSTLFNEHSEILVQGTKDANGVFHAENVQVKCPSKYETAQSNGEQAAY